MRKSDIKNSKQKKKREREKESGGNVLGMGAQKGTELCECEALELTATQ